MVAAVLDIVPLRGGLPVMYVLEEYSRRGGEISKAQKVLRELERAGEITINSDAIVQRTKQPSMRYTILAAIPYEPVNRIEVMKWAAYNNIEFEDASIMIAHLVSTGVIYSPRPNMLERVN